MSKKENDVKTNIEENMYQCYNCNYMQGSIFEVCPKCGAKNVFEE